MSEPRVAVLGGGPAGLGVAYRLGLRERFRVTVLERADRVGGNAGSFELAGMRVDHGSHRLHPACPPEILGDIRAFLGDDLLERPRHGRIRLRGRWLRFPLRPLNLLTNLPPDFVAGVLRDLLPGGRPSSGRESFASVLEAGLGRTICRDFYFPYARKIWGLPPEELDAEQARRRVAAGSRRKIVGKVLASVPGLRPPGTGIFYYPRGGFGRISEAYRDAAEAAGAEVLTGAEVVAIDRTAGEGIAVRARRGDAEIALEVDTVLSSIPVTVTARLLRPACPLSVARALEGMRYRGMVLVYLVLSVDRFAEYDAHYFPGPEVPFSRVSEPKNYGLHGPPGRTVLCAELPCDVDDGVWRGDDGELRQRVAAGIRGSGLDLPEDAIDGHAVRRLTNAYPVYRRGWAEAFDAVDEWVGTQPGVVSFGRQGLFAHDNTHHTLAMAYALADSLDDDGRLRKARWEAARASFESFVVED